MVAGGDGHRLVEAAGGQLLNMDVTYGPELRFISRARTWISGLAAFRPLVIAIDRHGSKIRSTLGYAGIHQKAARHLATPGKQPVR